MFSIPYISTKHAILDTFHPIDTLFLKFKTSQMEEGTSFPLKKHFKTSFQLVLEHKTLSEFSHHKPTTNPLLLLTNCRSTKRSESLHSCKPPLLQSLGSLCYFSCSSSLTCKYTTPFISFLQSLGQIQYKKLQRVECKTQLGQILEGMARKSFSRMYIL